MRIGTTISEEFNEFSINYTSDMIGCVPYYLFLMDAMIADLPRGFKPDSILDLGCGNGNVTANLIRTFPDSSYTLLDASPEMIALCARRFEGYQVTYKTCYFSEYDFPENSFDMITAGFSLHHCSAEEKRELFRKIFGSLKKGGVFGCSDLMIGKQHPAHPQLLESWKAFVHKQFPDGEKWDWLMEHYAEFDKPDHSDDQIKWLKDAGFNAVSLNAKDEFWAHIRAVKLSE